MRFSNIVFAAFVAVSQLVIAAPIETELLEARNDKPKPIFIPFEHNNNNAIVAGSGNGGNGGTNVAIPVALSGAKSSSGGKTGKTVVVSSAGNEVDQSANGGDGSVVGTYGSGNTFSERGGSKPVVIPVWGNDNNALIIGSGNGGEGGTNVAVPVALSGASSSTKGKTGKVTVGSSAGNAVWQSANGGDGFVVGSYGSNNDLEARGKWEPATVIPAFKNNDNNAIIVGSGNGGDGGENVAVPIAGSIASSSSKGWTGKVIVSSQAGNAVGQSANGGDGEAVGTYGSHNQIARGGSWSKPQPVVVPVLSNNDNNAVILGSGNGGNGGLNVAVPVAVAASGSSTKSGKTGSVSVGTGAGNIVSQGADGGDGSVVGTYGENNHF